MITGRQSRTDRIIFAGIIGLLIFAPLAFGSVHVWAYTLVELGVFLLLILWVANRCIFSKSGTLSWVKTPVNLFLILLLFFVGLQLVPLPSAWTTFLSPQTHADKIQLHELMAQFDSSVIHWFAPANFLHPVVIDGLKLLTYPVRFWRCSFDNPAPDSDVFTGVGQSQNGFPVFFGGDTVFRAVVFRIACGNYFTGCGHAGDIDIISF